MRNNIISISVDDETYRILLTDAEKHMRSIRKHALFLLKTELRKSYTFEGDNAASSVGAAAK